MFQSTDALQNELELQTNVTLPPDHSLLVKILETGVAATTVINSDGQIVVANDAAEKVLNTPKALITQRTHNALEWKITDFEGKPLPDAEFPFIQVMKMGEAVVNVQQAIASGTGERRYLLVNGSPIRDAADTITHVVLSLTDITEFVRLQHLQQESLDLYRKAFEANSALKLVIDPVTSEIVDANLAASMFYGYPVDVLKQMKMTDIIQQPTEAVQSGIEQSQVQEHGRSRFSHRLASGEIRQVEVHSSWLKVSGRKLLYSVVHDITERQEFELALQSQIQQDRLLEDVTQTIRQSLDLKVILQTTVNEVRKLLKADRVIIYRPTVLGDSGAVVVESCALNHPPLVGWRIGDNTSKQQQFVELFQQVQNQAITNISQCELEPAYREILQTFNVKSQLTIPIFLRAAKVWGLLIVHQCDFNRQWQDWEISLLQRLETQLAVAIQQAEFHQQVQQLNIDLEAQIQERTIQLQESLNAEAVLRHITEKIHKTLDEKSILQTVVQELGLSLNLKSCHASFYDLKQQTASVCHEYVNSGVALQGIVTSIADYPEVYQPLLKGEYLQFCSTSIYRPTVSELVLYYPIVDGEQGIWGDLKLISAKTHLFKPQDLQLVRQVTQQCAIAIRQSRLYQSAQAQIRELEKLNRLQEDFLCTTSHELRTPLSSIKMAIQLINVLLRQSDQLLTPKIEHCLSILQEECDREINLINDLLLLQQLNAGTHPFLASRVSLKDWLPSVIETFEEKFKEHQLSCQIDISCDIPPIMTDLDMFDRVLDELVTNACKFTPLGETILFKAQYISSSTNAQNNYIQISITNTGVEIPTDELPSIFNQFYRVPSNDPWKHSGTGLGLALVKKLVSFLGGSIKATSGSGQTCFTIDLPLRGEDCTENSGEIHHGCE